MIVRGRSGIYDVSKTNNSPKEISTIRTVCLFTSALICSIVFSTSSSIIVHRVLTMNMDKRGFCLSNDKQESGGFGPNNEIVRTADKMQNSTYRHKPITFFADAPECNTSQGIMRYRRILHPREGIYNHSTFQCFSRGVYIISFTLVRKRARTRHSPVSCTIMKTNTQKTRQQLAFIELQANKSRDKYTEIGSVAETRTIMEQLDEGDIVYVNTPNNPCSDMEHWTSFSVFLLFTN